MLVRDSLPGSARLAREGGWEDGWGDGGWGGAMLAALPLDSFLGSLCATSLDAGSLNVRCWSPAQRGAPALDVMVGALYRVECARSVPSA